MSHGEPGATQAAAASSYAMHGGQWLHSGSTAVQCPNAQTSPQVGSQVVLLVELVLDVLVLVVQGCKMHSQVLAPISPAAMQVRSLGYSKLPGG